MLLYKCKCGLITNEFTTKCQRCNREFSRKKLLVDDTEIQTPCSNCGCYEYYQDLRNDMCEDCYEEWKDDCKESEED